MKNVDILRKIDIFAQVSAADLERIAELLKEKKVEKDAVLFKQGDLGDALYVVQSGQFKSVTTDLANREKIQGFLTEGQSVGEMALLAGEPRTSTMLAMAGCRVWTLRKEDFDKFLSSNVSVMLQMMKIIAQKQAASASKASQDTPSLEASGLLGRVFTVFSPKGGVGKSTIAVNLAVALAHAHPESVVLLDLSLTFGHDLLLLILSSRSSLSATSADALRSMGLEDGLKYYLTFHSPSTLWVMSGALKPEEAELVTGDTVKAAIEQLRRHFAYIVVDTGSNFGDPVLAAMENSERVVILCSPEISTLRDLKECQRILNDVVHIRRDQMKFVMNQIFPFKTLSKEQFETALQQELYMEIPYSADSPAKAALRGEALVETQSGTPMAKTLQKLAVQLVAEGERASAGAGQDKKRGFFR